MEYSEAVAKVEELLYDLICGGGGNADTIKQLAEEIADLFYEPEGT